MPTSVILALVKHYDQQQRSLLSRVSEKVRGFFSRLFAVPMALVFGLVIRPFYQLAHTMHAMRKRNKHRSLHAGPNIVTTWLFRMPLEFLRAWIVALFFTAHIVWHYALKQGLPMTLMLMDEHINWRNSEGKRAGNPNAFRFDGWDVLLVMAWVFVIG